MRGWRGLVRASAMMHAGETDVTCMTYDQISSLVVLLQSRLEPPYTCLQIPCALPAVVGTPAELRCVKIRVPALDVQCPVALGAKYIQNGLRENLLHESVETGRADSHEDMHPF